MKNFRNDLVKITATLLLISAMGIVTFNYATATQDDIQLCTILKDSQGSY